MKRNIIWIKESNTLRQALSSGIEFSFVSPDNKQATPFAYCKDYLQDAVQGFIINKKRSIFGFTYDPAIHAPLCIKRTKLLVANSQEFEFDKKMLNCLDFIHQVEEHLKIRKTIVSKCKNPPLKYIRSGVWLFDGSSRWIKSPPMLSMYTLLIRLGFGHNIGDNYKNTLSYILNGEIKSYQPVDSFRLKQAKAGIDRIFETGDRKIFNSDIKKNYPSSIKINVMHNLLGIIGFSQGISKKYVPEWH